MLTVRSDLRQRWRELLALGPSHTGAPAQAALDLARAERRACVEGWWYDWRPDLEASREEGAPRFVAALYSADDDDSPLAALGGCEYDDASYRRVVEAELALEVSEEIAKAARQALEQAAKACHEACEGLEPSELALPAHEALTSAALGFERLAEGLREGVR